MRQLGRNSYFELFPPMEIVLNCASLQGISRLWRKKKRVLMDEHHYSSNPVILRMNRCYGKYLFQQRL